ncbi:MAG: alanine--tRNA ligase [delta proteobacterium ML8_F1]|nr:MAG: alanine--tRNA ligase [delta proteobacterium ML8_F1]
MKNLGLNEIRKAFLDFFESKGHYVASSYSLVPKNDKSLLLVNAGMAPLKNYFIGAEEPPAKRMATCQKCIRTGDIENVGRTARHATFFEMLGNFSFGDYFKEESIAWGWEFATQVLEIPEEKLWATVYYEDDEAYEIWKNNIGIPEERIVRLGKEDNFWEIGVGPCGPCSEIYYDRGEDYSCGDPEHKPGCECDQFLEFWNHVFTQFNKNEDGFYTELKNKNIDTGMGLERIAAILQGVDSIFEVDTIRAILDKVVAISGRPYQRDESTDVSLRIITDHIRAVTFLISDGVLPDNEGRGYVLRRLLRRAARHGRLLGIEGPFLDQVAEVAIEMSSQAYENLASKRDFILRVIAHEEQRFSETIDQGHQILFDYIEAYRQKGVLPGIEAFKLYDTYGFPLDLTKEILEEIGMEVDEEGFSEAMEAQRSRARKAREKGEGPGWEEELTRLLREFPRTSFLGYETLESTGKCAGILRGNEKVEFATEGQKVRIITDQTPFYPQSGGQVGDRGVITGPGVVITIRDTHKSAAGVILHEGELTRGDLEVGMTLTMTVDGPSRRATAKNHTTTHLLHKALKIVLGDHVEQAGSYVDASRLRFDFSHIGPMTPDEIQKVEDIVNGEIQKGQAVTVEEMGLEEARAAGAMALFDEKYDEVVRVVRAGDFSTELCGGTHLTNTGEANLFKILSETGIAAGTRRIEALTGQAAIEYYQELENTFNAVLEIIKVNKDEILSRSKHLVQDMKHLMKENELLKSKVAARQLEAALDRRVILEGISIFSHGFDQVDVNVLREMGDRLKNQLGEYLVVLGTTLEEKVVYIAMASPKAIEKGLHAGNVVREVAKLSGGSGGGKPHMAQAGGSEPQSMEQALEKVVEIAKNMLK